MDGKLIGLMRDTLIRRYGEKLWASLTRDTASVDGPSDSLACWLGRDAVPAMEESFPSLFERHADLESFIRGLGDELPVSGARGDGDPMRVSFRHVRTPDGEILLRIDADCVVCALVQGVIAGAAIHYGEGISIEEIKSRKRGDNACVLRISLGIPMAATREYVAVGSA